MENSYVGDIFFNISIYIYVYIWKSKNDKKTFPIVPNLQTDCGLEDLFEGGLT